VVFTTKELRGSPKVRITGFNNSDFFFVVLLSV